MNVFRNPVALALAVVTAACAVFAVVAGITSDDDGGGSTVAGAPPAATVPGASTTEVTIADFNFAPPEVTVSPGGAVTWTNQDAFAHSVIAGDRSFASDDLNEGGQFTFTFPAAGTYRYVCGIHPSMAGTVIVT